MLPDMALSAPAGAMLDELRTQAQEAAMVELSRVTTVTAFSDRSLTWCSTTRTSTSFLTRPKSSWRCVRSVNERAKSSVAGASSLVMVHLDHDARAARRSGSSRRDDDRRLPPYITIAAKRFASTSAGRHF
jgi:hypothetical protein